MRITESRERRKCYFHPAVGTVVSDRHGLAQNRNLERRQAYGLTDQTHPLEIQRRPKWRSKSFHEAVSKRIEIVHRHEERKDYRCGCGTQNNHGIRGEVAAMRLIDHF